MAGCIQGIIFDLDGVIADSHPIHEKAWSALLREAGRKVYDSDLRFMREGRTRADMLAHFFPQASGEELEAFSKRKDELYADNLHRLQPVPGVVQWIRDLEQFYPLAVATCAGRQRTVQTLQAFGLAETFRVVVTGSDVSNGKPNPAVFLSAAERLGIPPDEALVVEDSVSGLTAAKSAGMICLVYAPAGPDERLFALQPDYVVSEFSQMELAPVAARLAASRTAAG